MATANAADSTFVSNGNGNPLTMFGRYGLPGLVIAVLLYFSWWNMNKVSNVVEKNTEAMVEFKGALKDNTAAVKELRDERARDRVERRAR
jgi:hypothetical protein